MACRNPSMAKSISKSPTNGVFPSVFALRDVYPLDSPASQQRRQWYWWLLGSCRTLKQRISLTIIVYLLEGSRNNLSLNRIEALFTQLVKLEPSSHALKTHRNWTQPQRQGHTILYGLLVLFLPLPYPVPAWANKDSFYFPPTSTVAN